MKTWHVLVIAVAAFFCGLASGAAVWRRASKGEERHRDFCTGTRLGVHEDRRAFESSDPQRREAALNRFYEGSTIYHGSQSILACIDEEDLPTLGFCHLNRDWACLAKVARQIEEQLDQTIGR